MNPWAFPGHEAPKWIFLLYALNEATDHTIQIVYLQFSSVQSLKRVWLFVTPWTAVGQGSLSITNSQSFTQTHVHWVGDAIQLSHPLLPLSAPAFNLSSIRVFSDESALRIRWLKYWSFSINSFNKYSALSSFRINWLELLAVQGTLRVFSNTVQKHQFFGAQFSLWSNFSIHTWLLEKP